MSATTTVPAKAAKSATPPPSDRAGALAADRAASFPIPSGREEAWRFTPLEPLRALLEGTPASGPEPSLDWTASGDAEGIAAGEPPPIHCFKGISASQSPTVGMCPKSSTQCCSATSRGLYS